MLLLAQQNTIYYSEAAKNQSLFSLHFKQKSMDIYINQQAAKNKTRSKLNWIIL